MEGNVKLLGADGMRGMEFTGDKANVYNDARYVMESMTTIQTSFSILKI
ncbi:MULTISPECIES: hypothetical protein [Bacillus]|nr:MULTISPECIES: hypothetical protein [Bacillus]MDE7553729.1 hypothetical protein [Bacillus tropicus]